MSRQSLPSRSPIEIISCRHEGLLKFDSVSFPFGFDLALASTQAIERNVAQGCVISGSIERVQFALVEECADVESTRGVYDLSHGVLCRPSLEIRAIFFHRRIDGRI